MKKQIMISKFFASKQQNSTRRNCVTVTCSTDGGSSSTKQDTEVKQEKTTDSSPTSTKKRILCDTALNGDEIEENIAKRSKLANDEMSPNTSTSNVSKLSDRTIEKLKSFSADIDFTSSNSSRDKSSDACLENQKCKLSPLISLDAEDDSDKTASESVQRQDSAVRDKISSDDEPMPGTSTFSEDVPLYSRCERLHKYTSVKPKSVDVTCSVNKKTKCQYTPLELQVVALKEKHQDAVLFVECGYKYRFFGEDAEIAAKVLKIFCHPDHNFMTASIPTHRLFVHVRRLVAAGYKVGVVKQTETAALKAAGENRAAPFSRELTALYTKSTLIGEDVDPLTDLNVSAEQDSSGPNAHLTCIFEIPPPSELCSKSKPQKIAVMSIQPSTGDVIYDCFDDGITRSELETRLLHIQPAEMLLPQTLTHTTDRLIHSLVSLSSVEDDRIRVERLEDSLFEHGRALETVTEFYSENEKGSELLQQVICLPRQVLCCLAALISYLQQFNLHGVLRSLGSITQFTSKTKFMDLNGTSLRNLEIFKNLTDGGEKGTLFWVMNQTVTRFGSRLLRKWISQPLLEASEIRERQAAVEELLTTDISELGKLPATLKRLPDLEKGLTTIYHKKSSTAEFYMVVQALSRVQHCLGQLTETVQSNVKSVLLQQVLLSIPELLADIDSYHSALNEKAAKDNDKTNLFVDESQFPAIIKRKIEIESVLSELKGHRREVRLTLRHPSLEYVTVLGTEFLVEVRNSNLKLVPSEWVKISCTKAVTRFHTPFIEQKYRELCQLREKLVLDCAQAWEHFLERFGRNYQSYRRAIQNLALLDCLFSLVHVARQPGYCCPEMVDSVELSITDGRHPVVDQLLAEQDQYVPNNTSLQTDGERVMIITGPNMGGKSSYIRQVALITIMAQIGSHVPAEQARIGVFDAIYTRMGARDEIFHGRSTFMVELQEAGEIMQRSSQRSLVILDELGRGTSTHDGVAIAMAALNFFITQVKCLTLFVTHYPSLAQFEILHPLHVHNYHMSFMLQDEIDDLPGGLGGEAITFLYQLVRGTAARSYGLNVARLADLPTMVLQLAAERSKQLEYTVSRQRSQVAEFRQVFDCLDIKDLRRIVAGDEMAMTTD